MKISVIVPVYNESECIGKLVKALEPSRGKAEFIFADGGSSDGCTDALPDWITVIHAPKGRAGQMNAGARAASGDVLFFLHCDTLPPVDFCDGIAAVMKCHPFGCFGIRFSGGRFLMKICAVLSNFRASVRRIIFGDQGLFISRDLFFHLGCFPSVPIMEDYMFSMILKKYGFRGGMTKSRLVTSDRRFPRGAAALCVMWRMQKLQHMLRCGVSPEIIASAYKDVR